MTLETGLRYPYQFAGLVGISGYVNEPENLIKKLSPIAKEQKFLITHGTTDPLLPLKKTKGHVDQLSAAGVNIQWEVFEKEHTCRNATFAAQSLRVWGADETRERIKLSKRKA